MSISVSANLTTYELFRILLPGYYAFGLLFLYIWLFAPWLVAKLVANGTFFGVLCVAAGVFLGLVIYAIDWPAKRRVFKVRNKLAEFIIDRAKKCPDGPKLPIEKTEEAHTLYWFILDIDVPAQRRERIYYFGSVYRVYADIRITTALMMVLIPSTVLAELLPSCSLQDLVLAKLFSIYQIHLVATAVLVAVFLVLTIYNKGDSHWKSIIDGQLLWLKLHPEVVDNLVCKKSVDLWSRAEDRAKSLGYASLSEYITELIKKDKEQGILKKPE